MPGNITLPETFLERLKRIVPIDQADAVLQSFTAERPLALRCNTQRLSVQHAKEILAHHHIEFEEFTPLPQTLLVPAHFRQQALNLPEYEKGYFYAQGLASQLAVLALSPAPGEEILDMCAAPGGKTAYITCLMQAKGRLAAVEKVKARYHKLQRNLKWQGHEEVHTYHKDGIPLWRKVPERFDRVLLDAPCSSEARFDARDPKTYAHWNLKKIKEAAKKQRGLAYSALRSLKPGGRLTYSTCSFAPEENEAIIHWLLHKFSGQVQVESIAIDIPNRQAGLTQWEGKTFDSQVKRCMRVLPNAYMSGFFICNLLKLPRPSE